MLQAPGLATVPAGALATVASGAVTRDVAGHDGTAGHDPHVTHGWPPTGPGG